MLRRDFLKGLGTAAGAMPLLAATSRKAEAGLYPKRLIFVFSGNGTIAERWAPTGTETDWTPGRILEPLLPHKSHVNVLDGIKNETSYHGPGDGHMKGIGCLLTGTELLAGTQFKCGGTNPCAGWGGGISLDEYLANTLSARGQLPTKFRTLNLGVGVGGATVWSRMSYAGADRPNTPITDPAVVFQTVFKDLTLSRTDLDRLRAQKKSVLDYVTGRIGSVQQRVGADDRLKLQAHLDGIRDIERQLATAQPSACTAPAVPTATTRSPFPEQLKAQTDLMVKALSCDLTRIVTLQWGQSVSGVRMTWIPGVDRGHHDYSHDGDTNADSIEKLTLINRWYTEQFAYLLEQLKLVREGDGTMLDNTVVVWGNELGRGNSHSRERIPFVMAGSAGGYFRTGRYLKYAKDPHQNLLVSLCHAMGVEDQAKFGNPAYCTGPLRGLR